MLEENELTPGSTYRFVGTRVQCGDGSAGWVQRNNEHDSYVIKDDLSSCMLKDAKPITIRRFFERIDILD